jgi:hypothetical protein
MAALRLLPDTVTVAECIKNNFFDLAVKNFPSEKDFTAKSGRPFGRPKSNKVKKFKKEKREAAALWPLS